MNTFAELGIPFPLYEAPIDTADDSDYSGRGRCCICGTPDSPCFSLGIGKALIIDCPECGAANGLDVDNKSGVPCRVCETVVDLPDRVAAKKEPKTCYHCLRAGKAALTKATEFGLVSWDQAFSGVTNGVPGLRQDQFEPVVLDAEENWLGVKLPQEIMFELLRTPTYGTWQGERWLFCCRNPMTYVGEWQRRQFNDNAADGNGEQLYYSVVEGVPTDSWDALGQRIAVYVFACKQCGRRRAHWDAD